MLTITLTDAEVSQLLDEWRGWGDSSYIHHAGYILADALMRDHPDLFPVDENDH